MRTRLLLTVVVLGAVAAGCTTTSEGTPLPASTSTSDTSSADEPSSPDDELPSDGAPKVESPMDVSSFEQAPCGVLTPAQTQVLNIPATGDEKEDSLGKTCYWRNSETRGSVSVTFFSGDERGLSSVYREAKGSDFPYFKPVEDIEGYPAVAFNPKVAEPTIDCAVAVGVTDQLSFLVQVALSDANIGNRDPCDAATQVAGMVMKTMKEAA